MDHEVVPRSCKMCDYFFCMSRDHFNLHQGKNIRITMEFEVPKRHKIGFLLEFESCKKNKEMVVTPTKTICLKEESA